MAANDKVNNMKLFPTFLALAISFSLVDAAKLRYNYAMPRTNEGDSEDDTDESRRMQVGGGCCGTTLRGYWSDFSQQDFCLERVEDVASNDDKVKFLPCNETNPAQMWKFDVTPFDGNPGDLFMYSGLLYNMVNGCLAYRGDVELEKNLKVVVCDKNSAKQQWKSDGDTLFLRDYPDFCVSPLTHPIKARDPVVLLDCATTYSLDY